MVEPRVVSLRRTPEAAMPMNQAESRVHVSAEKADTLRQKALSSFRIRQLEVPAASERLHKSFPGAKIVMSWVGENKPPKVYVGHVWNSLAKRAVEARICRRKGAEKAEEAGKAEEEEEAGGTEDAEDAEEAQAEQVEPTTDPPSAGETHSFRGKSSAHNRSRRSITLSTSNVQHFPYLKRSNLCGAST